MSRSLSVPNRWQLVLNEWQRAIQEHATHRRSFARQLYWMQMATNAIALAGSATGCVALANPGVATLISVVGCGVATTAIAAQLTFFPTSRIREHSSLASRYFDLSRRIDIEKVRLPTSAVEAQNRLSDISDEYAKLDENATGVLGVQRNVPEDFDLESRVRDVASSPGNTAMAGLGFGLWSYATAMSDAVERDASSAAES